MSKDLQTVTTDGTRIIKHIEGVIIKKRSTHIDDRGSVCEMIDQRWEIINEPILYSYFYTTRPKKIKGWGMHKTYSDRYFVVTGEIELVLYDDRASSSTYKNICRYYLSEYDRCLITIPPFVWHVHKNIGDKDAMIVNFPTKPYDHNNPDKYRKAIDCDELPYPFKATI